jgi:hypothetical protein
VHLAPYVPPAVQECGSPRLGGPAVGFHHRYSTHCAHALYSTRCTRALYSCTVLYTLYSCTVLVHCTLHTVLVHCTHALYSTRCTRALYSCTVLYTLYSGKVPMVGNVPALRHRFQKQCLTVQYETSNWQRTGEWAPSVASVVSADSVVDPYNASLALTYCDHFVHLDPIHQVLLCRTRGTHC